MDKHAILETPFAGVHGFEHADTVVALQSTGIGRGMIAMQMRVKQISISPQMSREMDRMHLTVRAAMQDIAAGEQVITIPLRLALMDSPDDPEAASFGLQVQLQSSYLHNPHTPCGLGSRSDFVAMASLRDASPRLATMMCVSGPQDAPWGVRLASKLLRELAKGEESRWVPYLQVSPDRLAVSASGASRKNPCR